MSGFSDTRDDDPALAIEQQLDRCHKVVVKTTGQCMDRVRFGYQNLASQLERSLSIDFRYHAREYNKEPRHLPHARLQTGLADWSV